MLLLLARFVLVLVIVAVIVGIILYIAKNTMKDSTVMNIRKFEKRFDPESNKYYIVKMDAKNNEEPIRRWYGTKITYKDLVKVEYVLEKLNNIK